MIQLPSQLGRKGALTPEITPESMSAAEILVGAHAIQVTVPLPFIAEDDLDLVVTRSSIRVRSKSRADGPSYLIPLPVSVQPGRFVLRHANGLLDFTLERASG